MEHMEQEITCAVCSEFYREPVTVPCGHTFCRECLIKSTREKPVCPVCRSIFLSSARDMKENITIASIVRKLRRHEQPQTSAGNDRRQSIHERAERLHQGVVTKKKVENKILVKVGCKELLQPFLKSKIKLRLEPSLRESLRNFVVVQDLSYAKLGVEGRMNSLMAAEYQSSTEFEGVFEGICYFEITEEKLVDYENDGTPLQVKVCSGYELHEQSRLSLRDFEYFFSVFDRLPHPYILNSVFTRVDQALFLERRNLTGLSYAALALLKVADEERYQLLTGFDEDQRLSKIDSCLNRYAIDDLVRNPSLAFKMSIPGNYSSTFLFIFIIVMLIFYSYEFGSEEL